MLVARLFCNMQMSFLLHHEMSQQQQQQHQPSCHGHQTIFKATAQAPTHVPKSILLYGPPGTALLLWPSWYSPLDAGLIAQPSWYRPPGTALLVWPSWQVCPYGQHLCLFPGPMWNGCAAVLSTLSICSAAGLLLHYCLAEHETAGHYMGA